MWIVDAIRLLAETRYGRLLLRAGATLVVVSLVVGGAWLFFDESTQAAEGDFAIYREATGLELITTALATHAWDTTVTQGTGFSMNGASTTVTLSDVGHYLVMYNLGVEANTGTKLNEIQSLIDVNGTNSVYGRSSCTVTRSNGQNACWMNGAAIIETTASNQTVSVESQLSDTSGASIRRRAGESGLMLLRLDELFTYARYREAGGGQTFNATGFATVLLDNNDEQDTGFSRTNGDITLSEAGHYLVTMNVAFTSATNKNRNVQTRLTLNGYELPGTRVTAFMEGTNSAVDGTASWMGIIEATTTNQVLRIEGACEGDSCGSVSNVGGQTGITLAKLPDTAHYIRLNEIGGGQAVDGTNAPVTWDSQDEINSSSFSHSTSSNTSRITLAADGDYLFFSNFFASRGVTTGVMSPHWRWRLNAGVQTYGSFGRLLYGDNGPNGTFTSGSAGGFIASNASLNDYFELANTDESTSADASATFQANRMGVQAVRIDTLIAKDVTVSSIGTQIATTSIPVTDEYIGGKFVIAPNRGNETVETITIAETGSVNAQSQLDNIRLYYDLDTNSPHDCVDETYEEGVDDQYGSTDTNGFDGADGESTFTESVAIGTSSVMCVYVVLDVLDTASNGDTLDIEIPDPSTDVTITSGEVDPAGTVALTDSTTLEKYELVQEHYHWRLDNNTEALAGSAAGAEDTPLGTLSKGVPRRLRLEVSNEGGGDAPSTQFRLEYAPIDGACATTDTGWTDVGVSDGGAFDMYNSGNLTNGADTTNIGTSTGGVTDENDTFLTPNGGVRTTSSQTGGLVLADTEFVELEFAIEAITGAVEGTTYCFRLTDAGTELDRYDVIAQATIVADIVVSATGTQAAAVDKNTVDNFLGGTFVLSDQTGTDEHEIQTITISENGSVDGSTGIENLELYYEYDTTNPYICDGLTYEGVGGETQFGTTDSNGFDAADGSSTFSGSAFASSTQSVCVYVIYDVTVAAANGETIQVQITNPQSEVVLVSGSVTPNIPVALAGTTTINGEVLNQVGYHWRMDDGDETGATSATGGLENTALTNVVRGETYRLRFAITNDGNATSSARQYRVEYAPNTGLCSTTISGWVDIGSAGGDWEMSDSPFVSDSSDTSNIATTSGGITDPNTTFVTPNSAFKDTSSQTGAISLAGNEFVELEYGIEATTDATFGSTYCFRVTDQGSTIDSYDRVAEATIRNNQDFYIQRGTTTIESGSTSALIVAGSEYVRPKGTSTAFVRLTNTQHTGAGVESGGGNQNNDDVAVYIADGLPLTQGVLFERFGNAGESRIAWEIVEYIGPSGGDNEMIVRDVAVNTFGTADLSFTSSAITSVADGDDVVVFVTGHGSPDVGRNNYNTSLTTANFSSSTEQYTLTRSEAGGDAISVSTAVVEFTGDNWLIQRAEHNYTAAGTTETESITPVGATERAFLHVQKRVTTDSSVNGYGHEVWLSATSSISFQIESGVTAANHVSVAWVIENTQLTGTPMVVTRSNDTQSGTADPEVTNKNIGKTLGDLSIASIFTNNRVTGSQATYPRPIMSVRLISVTQYELWTSDSGETRTYRTEVVEWPTAEQTLTQNYYRWYEEDGNLPPSTAWDGLGENTAILSGNNPPGNGSQLRLRMSILVGGGAVSAGTKQFALQFGERVSTCSSIAEWFPVGVVGSSTALWRGADGTQVDGIAVSTNPPNPAHVMSVTDRSGTYEESAPSAVNPYKVSIGEDVEYDWLIEANGASSSAVYCFRMTESDGTLLTSYGLYPTLTTAGFGIESGTWQFFDDSESLTPSVALDGAGEEVAPADVAFDDPFKLRIMVHETGGSPGTAKFRLQYSDTPDFSANVSFVENPDRCDITESAFCYADGAGIEHESVDATVLTGAGPCTSGSGEGCGTHNELHYVPYSFGEVGTVVTDSSGTTVNLENTYINPVIIAEAISGDDGGGATNDPAAAQITATTSNSFTVRIHEPDNEADDHGTETVSYIVMEEGTYTQRATGVVLVDAGLAEVSDYYGNAVTGTSDGTCTFGQSFATTPVLLTSLQSDNNASSPDFLTSSALAVTSTQFTCSLEVPDGETNEPTQSETYGWIAFYPGANANNGVRYLASTTAASVTGWSDTPWTSEDWSPFEFFGSETPQLVANKQTRNGAEGGWVRYDSVTPFAANVAIDERDDGERSHTSETVGYVAFSNVSSSTLTIGKNPTYVLGANAAAEHEFTLKRAYAESNTTYYFRLYDWVSNQPVTSSTSLPSLSTEGAALSFSATGVPAGTTTEGIVTDITTTATSVSFDNIPLNTEQEAAHRISVTMNGLVGYYVYLYETQELTSNLDTIEEVVGTNDSPLDWSSACLLGAATGCWGYHVGDDTLSNGSTRFLIDDTYAALTNQPAEVAYHAGPASSIETDVIYKLEITGDQPAGTYQSSLVYLIVPIF